MGWLWIILGGAGLYMWWRLWDAHVRRHRRHWMTSRPPLGYGQVKLALAGLSRVQRKRAIGAWREIADAVRVPPRFVHPDDRFEEMEIASFWRGPDSDLDDIEALAAYLDIREQIETVGAFVRAAGLRSTTL